MLIIECLKIYENCRSDILDYFHNYIIEEHYLPKQDTLLKVISVYFVSNKN